MEGGPPCPPRLSHSSPPRLGGSLALHLAAVYGYSFRETALNHVGRPLFPLLLLFLLLAQVVRLLFERARPLLLD